MRKCPVCNNVFDRYVKIDNKYIELPRKYGRTVETRSEFLNKEEYSCPHCYAVDRDRMIVLLVKKLREKFLQAPFIRCLEIAPSGMLKKYFHIRWGECTLYSTDLFMENVDFNLDIQQMDQIQDEYFDLIVCSHVLEHVENDRKALQEIYRILDKRGLAVILVPIDLNRKSTDEENGLTEEENFRRFGQGDHVRAYSKKDYIRRLKECGFGVHLLNKKYFTKEEFENNAFIDTATLYLVYKDKKTYHKRKMITDSFLKYHRKAEPFTDTASGAEETNFWIDSCKITNNILSIWGWAYLKNHDSSKSKAKIRIQLENGRKIYYSFDFILREDIENAFPEETNCKCSGIDFSVRLERFSENEVKKIELIIFNNKISSIVPILGLFYS